MNVSIFFIVSLDSIVYLAKLILGERDDSLLQSYYWCEEFKDNLRAKHFSIVNMQKFSNKKVLTCWDKLYPG